MSSSSLFLICKKISSVMTANDKFNYLLLSILGLLVGVSEIITIGSLVPAISFVLHGNIGDFSLLASHSSRFRLLLASLFLASCFSLRLLLMWLILQKGNHISSNFFQKAYFSLLQVKGPSNDSSQLVTELIEGSNAFQYILTQSSQLITTSFIVIGFSSFLLLSNPLLSFLAIAACIIYYLFVYFLTKKSINNLSVVLRNKLSDRLGFVHSSIYNREILHAHNEFCVEVDFMKKSTIKSEKRRR